MFRNPFANARAKSPPVHNITNSATPKHCAHIVPFLVSTAGGAIIAGALLAALSRAGALRAMQASLS